MMTMNFDYLYTAEAGWKLSAAQKQRMVSYSLHAAPPAPLWVRWLPHLAKPLIGVAVAAATAVALLLVWPLIRQEPAQTEITAGAPGNSEEARPDEYVENSEQPSGNEEPNTPRQDPEETPAVTPPTDTDQSDKTPPEESRDTPAVIPPTDTDQSEETPTDSTTDSETLSNVYYDGYECRIQFTQNDVSLGIKEQKSFEELLLSENAHMTWINFETTQKAPEAPIYYSLDFFINEQKTLEQIMDIFDEQQIFENVKVIYFIHHIKEGEKLAHFAMDAEEVGTDRTIRADVIAKEHKVFNYDDFEKLPLDVIETIEVYEISVTEGYYHRIFLFTMKEENKATAEQIKKQLEEYGYTVGGIGIGY